MAEAIISRRGSGIDTSSGISVTETIVKSLNWTIPNHRGNISVMIFGGGGGGASLNGGGGGGGCMSNDTFDIENGITIPIYIGEGGLGSSREGDIYNGSAGGTSSFGTYLSANGGEAGTSGGNDGEKGVVI